MRLTSGVNPSMQGQSLANFLRQPLLAGLWRVHPVHGYRKEYDANSLPRGPAGLPGEKGDVIPGCQTRPQTFDYSRSNHQIYL